MMRFLMAVSSFSLEEAIVDGVVDGREEGGWEGGSVNGVEGRATWM